MPAEVELQKNYVGRSGEGPSSSFKCASRETSELAVGNEESTTNSTLTLTLNATPLRTRKPET